MSSSSTNLRVMTALGGGKIGGAEAFFVSLNLALKSAGCTMHAVLRNSPIHIRDIEAAGIPYDIVGFGGVFDFWSAGRLRRIAEKFRPDIVLTLASRASKHMPRGDYTLIGRLGGYYKLRYFEKCDWLVCNSPDVLRHVLENGWPKERAVLIANFPYIAELPPIPRSTFDTPDGVPLALALGRFHWKKGLDLLLRAAAQIPDLWVWIAGEGDEANRLKQLAHDLGIASRVRFVGWRTDRAALFKAVDVCVYPSREEPFGNVVVEAWSLGTPLVTTASQGPAWLVRPGEDAVLVPVEDVDGLAAGIRSVIASPDFAAQLVRKGKERVAGEFSEAAIVRQYLDLFERVRPR